MKKLFLFLLLVPICVNAGLFEYKCIIQQELFLQDNGVLKTYPNNLYVGESFIVDRVNGKVLGNPLSNRTASKIILHSKGDEDRPFELVSFSSLSIGKADTDYIYVKEYKDTPDKAFLATTGDSVFAGICK